MTVLLETPKAHCISMYKRKKSAIKFLCKSGLHSSAVSRNATNSLNFQHRLCNILIRPVFGGVQMEQLVRVLEKPIPYFSKDFSRYTQIFRYAPHGESPFFWEYDCLFVYVRSGHGRVLVNQTPYPLEPGCIV